MTSDNLLKLGEVSKKIFDMKFDFKMLRDSLYDWTSHEDVYGFYKKFEEARLLGAGLYLTFREEGCSKDTDPVYEEILTKLNNKLDELDKELLYDLSKKYGTKKEGS